MAEDKIESKKDKVSFELVEVATQTATMIKNVATGERLTIEQTLALILNELSSIKKAVA